MKYLYGFIFEFLFLIEEILSKSLVLIKLFKIYKINYLFEFFFKQTENFITKESNNTFGKHVNEIYFSYLFDLKTLYKSNAVIILFGDEKD